MTAQPWYLDPITQAHGVDGEQGVDFGTPFGTTLTAILPGTVQSVDCTVPWRCEVDILTAIQGQSFVESFLHVDQPLVSPGEQLAAGAEVGLSGGQLEGGMNPDSPSVSSGPHTEFDLFQGTSAWHNPIDPTAIAQGGPEIGSGGPGPSIPGIIGAFNPPALIGGVVTGQGPTLPGLPSLSFNFDPWAGFQQAAAGTAGAAGDWIHNRAVPFVGANVIALAVAALVLLVIFGSGDKSSQGPQILPVPV